MFVILGGIGISQPPPPSEHSHNWAEGSPIPKPGVAITPNYVRREGIVQVQPVIGAPDNDTCMVYWPPCSFPQNIAINGVKVVEWSDGGAGGTFGKLDANGQFVPESDPTKVTHYKPPYKPPESFTGHIAITVKVDDIPQAQDPATGQWIATYDDPAVTSDPTKFTVWEFEIDPPYVDALPQDGATYTFTATIRPEKDHNGNSMARIIEFGLGSSAEPGYCLNATRIQGLWTDTSEEDNDLKFVPDQPGLDVFVEGPNPTNFCHAITKKPETSISVQVRCLDYGAYGTVWASAYGLGGARLKGTLIEGGAQIPLDRDGNNIYDGWQYEGPEMDDNDADPKGNGTPGEGLSRYEEYRGFVVGGTHKRTNPNVKDVFIVKLLPDPFPGYEFDLGYFPNLGTMNHIIRDTEHQGGYVNFYHRYAHVMDVGRIELRDGGYSIIGLGVTNGALPRPAVSVIYTERIREAGPPTRDRYTWDVLDLEATLYTISHESGHAVNIPHHFTGTTSTCVMFQPQTPEEWQAFWDNIPNDYCVTNPGCRFLWFLRPRQ